MSPAKEFNLCFFSCCNGKSPSPKQLKEEFVCDYNLPVQFIPMRIFMVTECDTVAHIVCMSLCTCMFVCVCIKVSLCAPVYASLCVCAFVSMSL